MPITKTVFKISKKLEGFFKNKEEAFQTAWLLLENITQKTKTKLLQQKSFSLSAPVQQKLDYLIFQITVKNKPLAYILGYVPFLGLKILVEKPILIPRPETEEWTQKLIDHLKTKKIKELKILDLCAGTGCIALALANALPKSKVLATDISKKAIKLGKNNKKINSIKNIEFIESDLYQNIDKNLKFDLIVTNPPYITENDFINLSPKIKDWEDPVAFLGGKDGLKIIKKIIDETPEHMERKKMNPELWVEIGWNQANEVKKLFAAAGFKNFYILKDFAAKDRVVRGELD